jgi:hypothetical protein
MPDPTTPSRARRRAQDPDDDEHSSDELPDIDPPQSPQSTSSPQLRRRAFSTRSLLDHNRDSIAFADETSGLLGHADRPTGGGAYGGMDGSGLLSRSYRSFGPSTPGTPRPQRQLSYSTNTRFSRNVSRRGSFSFSQRLVTALGAAERPGSQRRDTRDAGGFTTVALEVR